MAEMVIGKVGLKFSDLTNSEKAEIKGENGEAGVSPVVSLESTATELTISVVDAEGLKVKTCAKGTTIYYTDTVPIGVDEVGTVWIGS